MKYPWLSFTVLFCLACFPAYAQTRSSSFGERASGAAAVHHGLSALPEAAQSSISAALGRDNSVYQVQRAKNKLLTVNQGRELTTNFTSAGIELQAGRWQWQMTLQALGYGGHLQSVESALPQARANRVEYRRRGLTEWYVNGPVGLEQGFTLDRRPGKSRGPLTLALATSGNLIPKLDEVGRGLVLNTPSGQTQFHYTGLSAKDARGKNLVAWLELRETGLLLRVKDDEARYPVVIDPWVQVAELKEGRPKNGDRLGWSVAVDGDSVVVGEVPDDNQGYLGRGAAYVFVKPATGWKDMTPTAKLSTADHGNCRWYYQCSFGYSVAVQGDTIVVGAPDAGSLSQGAAYVFVRPRSGWKTTARYNAKLVGKDESEDSEVGTSVAIDGGTIVAGGPSWSLAYVFVKPANGWKGQLESVAELTPSDGGGLEDFGGSVSVSGDTIVGGAIHYPLGEGPGAAYVFVEPAGGWVSMNQTATLTSSDGEKDDDLGWSVSIRADTVIAGAPRNPINNGERGAGYVFVKPNTGWKDMTQTAKLTASDGQQGDALGYSVSIRDNEIVAGAPDAGNNVQGAAYVFVKPAGGWKDMTQTSEIFASDGQAYDGFGYSVAIDTNTILAGAPYAPYNFKQSREGPGFTYVFGNH